MGQDLHKIGINTACAPVLDIPIEGADRVIGDRAYGRDPFTVAALGRAAARGLLDSGVLPVIKHIPGHGRAKADSHFALPVIDTPLEELNETDFAPFRELRDLPLAMTAHVVLSAVDPAAPVTTSPSAISSIIRGLIGYDGLLMSDDLSMKALSGSMPERTRSCIAAGCDLVLHCNGDLEEMEAIAASAPPLDGDGARRFEAALAALSHPRPFDLAEAEQAVAETLSTVA
jgi:beta-N-acetylhexosaminidase